MSDYVLETVEALLNDDFIIVPKMLAKAIGDREAGIVKQIWSWCKHNQKRKDKQHFKDGHYWTYNTYDEWLEEFPWLSKPTIQRKILKLEKMGLLVSDRFKAHQNDQTKWYRVDVTVLFSICKASNDATGEEDSRSHQNDVIDDRKMMSSRTRQNDAMSYKKNNVQTDANATGVQTPSAHAPEKDRLFTMPSGIDLQHKWINPVYLKYLELGYEPQVKEETTDEFGYTPSYFDPLEQRWTFIDYSWQSDWRKDMSDYEWEETHFYRLQRWVRDYLADRRESA